MRKFAEKHLLCALMLCVPLAGCKPAPKPSAATPIALSVSSPPGIIQYSSVGMTGQCMIESGIFQSCVPKPPAKRKAKPEIMALQSSSNDAPSTTPEWHNATLAPPASTEGNPFQEIINPELTPSLKNWHDFAVEQIKFHHAYLKSHGTIMDYDMSFVWNGGEAQTVKIGDDGKIELHGLSLQDAFLLVYMDLVGQQDQRQYDYDKLHKTEAPETQP